MLAAIPYRTFPEIDLGPLTLHTFGLLVGLGVLIGVFLFAYFMERELRFDRDEAYRFGFWLVVIGFVGARLTYVITNWRDLDGPFDVVKVWEGGLQFSGGFLGGIIYTALWLRAHRQVDRWRLVDGVAVALTAGLAIGRIGCYSVGEHLGGQTAFFLGVRYEGGVTRENAPLNDGPLFVIGDVIHNTALYEFIHLVVLFGVLVWLWRRARVAPGVLFVVFLYWYATVRFLTDFLRAYDRTRLGLTGAQYMMLAILVGAVVLTFRRARRPEPAPAAVTAGDAGGAADDGEVAEEPEPVAPAVVLGADWDEDAGEDNPSAK